MGTRADLAVCVVNAYGSGARCAILQGRNPTPTQNVPNAMIDYPQFRASHDDTVALVRSQNVARLVTVDADGWPHVGLHVFVHEGLNIEMHLLAGDPQVTDLESGRHAIVEIDEPLASARSEWVDPFDAAHGDQYYRCATIRGHIEVLADQAAVAQHLNHLLERYQAGASYLPVNWEEPVYAGYRTRLKVVRVRADVVSTKFKLGQTTPPESLARILNALNTRAGALDLHTAALIASAQSGRSLASTPEV